MPKLSPRFFWATALFLVLLTIPCRFREGLKRTAFFFLSPFWKAGQAAADPQFYSAESLELSALPPSEQKWNLLLWQCEQLKQSNRLLKEYHHQLSAMLFWNEEKQRLASSSSPFLLRRQKEYHRLTSLHAMGVMAQVIFRSPNTWNSLLYINAGAETNRQIGHEVIRRYSPVVYDNCVVGLIEEVGETQSMVRLITDPALKLSVRTARSFSHNASAAHYSRSLLNALSSTSQLSESENQLVDLLRRYLEERPEDSEGMLLAKGEMHGSKSSLFGVFSPSLIGVGFNYDLSDEEGAARDLHSGRYQHLSYTEEAEECPLIQRGDWLVTTGLDGVFPSGLFVGNVTKIIPRKEGAVGYDLEAKPALPRMHALTQLLVLPPLDFQEKE